ncbi:hypothetical protein ABK040_003235 [Willaertia magna]
MQQEEQENNSLHFIKTKHGKTRYILDGNLNSNHTIIFVPGITSHSFTYQSLTNTLIKLASSNNNNIENDNNIEKIDSNQNDNQNDKINFKTLRYDTYGRGKSSDPQELHTADLFVEQLFELIDQLILKKNNTLQNNLHLNEENSLQQNKKLNVEEKERITIVGFSMGGTIATCFTKKYPNLVNDLILFSPAGAYWNLPFGANILKVPFLGNFIYSTIQNFISDEQKLNGSLFCLNENVKEMIKNYLKLKREESTLNQDINCFLNSFKNFPLNGCDEEIKEIGRFNSTVKKETVMNKEQEEGDNNSGVHLHHRSTLLIWALFDTTVPSDECFSIYYEAMKDDEYCKFIILNNTRHLFYLERELDTANLILNFINRKENLIENVNIQKEPIYSCFGKGDEEKWNYFVNNDEYKKFIV